MLTYINPLNAELHPIRHLLASVGARHIVHVSRIRVHVSWNRTKQLSSRSAHDLALEMERGCMCVRDGELPSVAKLQTRVSTERFLFPRADTAAT
jgi:hypothetical protein